MPRAAAQDSPADTRERILAAALEAFAERGFDGAKTREIAARAEVPLGLLQYHFGAKPRLWRAAVDRAFGQLREGLETLRDGPQPGDDRELLRRLIRGHVGFVAANPEFAWLMHEEGKRRGPRMRWLVDRHVKPIYDAILPMIERGQRSGVLPREVPAIHLVYALVGAVDAIFHQAEECKRISGLDPTDAAEVEAHTRTIELLFLGSP